jgi:hypothetical protein
MNIRTAVFVASLMCVPFAASGQELPAWAREFADAEEKLGKVCRVGTPPPAVVDSMEGSDWQVAECAICAPADPKPGESAALCHRSRSL